MRIVTHILEDRNIAEIASDEIIINTIEEGIDLVGNIYFQGFHGAVLNERNITPAFFDLKNGMAGEILQKFSTYQLRLAIVGDFSKYKSMSLENFIHESNKGRLIHFVDSTAEALKFLSADN